MQDPAAIFSQMNHPQFPEQEHLKCPRCDSPNTKFCYYNNYNLSQPRHFCKNCKRYWTKGGVLRNIPVGGGSRKNSSKRNNINNKSSSTSTTTTPPSGTVTVASSSPPPQPPSMKSEPYNLMLINAAPFDQDRRMLDLSGGGNSFSSLLEANEGHFGHFTKDGLICDGSNLIDHGPDQSSVQAQDSLNGGPLDGYRPSCWSGSNASWPDHLAMYTPEGSSFQQFIEFPPSKTGDS